uniref:Uncharacterized protein n=1 Tax=Myotis myotis TaxID=51298 RepID=A0A7J7T5Q7_MYOMY|nr:hypothetical protein mMyoMyo1_009134 [Myotis myotis]
MPTYVGDCDVNHRSDCGAWTGLAAGSFQEPDLDRSHQDGSLPGRQLWRRDEDTRMLLLRKDKNILPLWLLPGLELLAASRLKREATSAKGRRNSMRQARRDGVGHGQGRSRQRGTLLILLGPTCLTGLPSALFLGSETRHEHLF